MPTNDPPGSMKVIEFGEDLRIPEQELKFTASRSSGPGGQNVNKVSTRVTLSFDISGTKALTEEQKQRICTRLANRVNKEGVLKIVCQRHRSQAKNRKAVLARFGELLTTALREETPRVKTRVSSAAKQRRLEDKVRRSHVKELRSKSVSIDE